MADASQQLARLRAARMARDQDTKPDEATDGELEDSQVSTSLSDVVGSTSRANSLEKFPEVATSERDNSGRSTPAATQENFVDTSDLSVLADVLDGASNYEERSMSPERVRALEKLEEDRSPSTNAQKRKLGQIGGEQPNEDVYKEKIRRLEQDKQALMDALKQQRDTTEKKEKASSDQLRKVRESNENFCDKASMVDEALRPKLTLSITLGPQRMKFELPPTALSKPYITYTRTARMDKVYNVRRTPDSAVAKQVQSIRSERSRERNT
ncbi:hypothetical protein HDK64DRAFT_297088 [Phyllosticta capitalensis]